MKLKSKTCARCLLIVFVWGLLHVNTLKVCHKWCAIGTSWNTNYLPYNLSTKLNKYVVDKESLAFWWYHLLFIIFLFRNNCGSSKSNTFKTQLKMGYFHWHCYDINIKVEIEGLFKIFNFHEWCRVNVCGVSFFAVRHSKSLLLHIKTLLL